MSKNSNSKKKNDKIRDRVEKKRSYAAGRKRVSDEYVGECIDLFLELDLTIREVVAYKDISTATFYKKIRNNDVLRKKYENATLEKAEIRMLAKMEKVVTTGELKHATMVALVKRIEKGVKEESEKTIYDSNGNEVGREVIVTKKDASTGDLALGAKISGAMPTEDQQLQQAPTKTIESMLSPDDAIKLLKEMDKLKNE